MQLLRQMRGHFWLVWEMSSACVLLSMWADENHTEEEKLSFSISHIPVFQLLVSYPFTLELCCFPVIRYYECSCCMQNSQLLVLFLKEWQLVVMWAVTWKQYNLQSVQLLNVVYLMCTSFVSHVFSFPLRLDSSWLLYKLVINTTFFD